jgi:DNA (cytosine-5)-methyltransferase 1
MPCRPAAQGSAEYERLRDSIVPPYDAGKFPNKWRKMWRDQPARTLMAHLGKDSYSHIHYDSEQARTRAPHRDAHTRHQVLVHRG